MPHSNSRSQHSGDRHNQDCLQTAGVEETQVTIDSGVQETIQSKQSDFRRKEPILSSQRAAKAARDLKLILVIDTKTLLDSKFTEKQRDRILAALLRFRPTEVKHELEECLEQLYVHVNPHLVELVRIWRKGMLEQVYPKPSETHHKTVDKQLQHLLKQFQDKLDERLDKLRNECLEFLYYAYGDIHSDSEESCFDDNPVLSPAVGPRPSVVFTFDDNHNPHPEDSESDTEMAELPTRKYSEMPTIPNRLAPPKQPKKFGEGMFAKPCVVCPSRWPTGNPQEQSRAGRSHGV